MKKAVLFCALLFSYLASFSSHQDGSEILKNFYERFSAHNYCDEISFNQPPSLLLNEESPNDTIMYLYLDQQSNTLFLSVNLENPAKMSIIVLDILGNIVWSMPEVIYDPGKQLLSGSMNLSYGQYIVKVLKNGSVFKTQKILVIK